jgi:predicted nucleotidyltransferase
MTLQRMAEFLSKSRRAEVLAFLSANPSRRLTINELAREANIPVATTWHAIQGLVEAGLVLKEVHPGVTIVKWNHLSPAAKALRDASLPDPHKMAFQAFEGLLKKQAPRLDVRLFGSVARDEHQAASDVDVEVVYGKAGIPRRKAMDLAAKASDEVLDTFNLVVTAVVNAEPMMQ